MSDHRRPLEAERDRLREMLAGIEARLARVRGDIEAQGQTIAGSQGQTVANPLLRVETQLTAEQRRTGAELGEVERQIAALPDPGPDALARFLALDQEAVFALPRDERVRLQDEIGKRPSGQLRRMLAAGELRHWHLRATRVLGGSEALVRNPRRSRRAAVR